MLRPSSIYVITHDERVVRLFYKFCPNLLNGGIHKDKGPTKLVALTLFSIPSDRAIPVL